MLMDEQPKQYSVPEEAEMVIPRNLDQLLPHQKIQKDTQPDHLFRQRLLLVILGVLLVIVTYILWKNAQENSYYEPVIVQEVVPGLP